MFKKPVIAVHLYNVDKAVLKEVLAGIEEEGVLYETYGGNQTTAEALAVEGSAISALEIGIGICEKKVCIHIRNLDSKEHLFKTHGNNLEDFRKLGANAARYVKGIPFK